MDGKIKNFWSELRLTLLNDRLHIFLFQAELNSQGFKEIGNITWAGERVVYKYSYLNNSDITENCVLWGVGNSVSSGWCYDRYTSDTKKGFAYRMLDAASGSSTLLKLFNSSISRFTLRVIASLITIFSQYILTLPSVKQGRSASK